MKLVTHILLRIEHTKPLPDLLDLAAGRVYSMDGVSDVTAGLVEDEPTEADWADFGAWAERDKAAMKLLEQLIDVLDDGQLPYEYRCYADGAWSELIAEARALTQPKEIQK